MNKKYLPSFIVSLLLFFIPFLWFNGGEMDLGGDSTRLYFYDPLSYLFNQSFYSITSSGIGGEAISFYSIPFITLLFLIKLVVTSPTIVIACIHGITLSIAFLFSFLTILEIVKVKKENEKLVIISAVSASLLYVFSPFLILGWDKAILTYNQYFLNPLLFYFILKFFLTNNSKYGVIALLITFLFSANFSYVAAPPFFAFYPLSILFILLYVHFIRKKNIELRKTIYLLLIFFFLHAFHLIPQIISLFSSGSGVNAAVFSDEAKFSRGLGYFLGIVTEVKVSRNLMMLPQMTTLGYFSFVFFVLPLCIILGFIWNKSKTYLLTGVFFLIILFLMSANITSIGLFFYKSLFSIPGFSMFRNFFGQWSYLFTFFYVLLLAQSFIILGEKFKKYKYIAPIFVGIILVINAISFIKGDSIDKIHHQSKGIRMLFSMDPKYEEVLAYLKETPIDGKILSFPLAGPGYQMIKGVNGGVYQGPSTISYLTGKNDFTGYAGLGIFGDTFLHSVRDRDFEAIDRIFTILNIKYIFHNSDPYIYDENFPGYPYDYVKDYMPKTQKEYSEFIQTLNLNKEKNIGKYYSIYSLPNKSYLPHIYASEKSTFTNNFLLPHFILPSNSEERATTLDISNASKDDAVIFEAQNISPIIELFNNYHLHVHAPFIARKLNDPLYHLISLKEQYTLHQKINNPDDYLDYSLLFLSKRIFELDMYKNSISIVRKRWNPPSTLSIFSGNSYNSWEASLTRYSNGADVIIDWIPKSGKTENGKRAIELKINENFHQHQVKLLKTINDSSFSIKDKKYLIDLVNNTFTRLFTKLDLSQYDPTDIEYEYIVPDVLTGDYEVFLRNLDDKIGDVSSMNLTIKRNGSNSHVIKNDGSLIQLSDVRLSQGRNKFNLRLQPDNLIDSTKWINYGSFSSTEDVSDLHFVNAAYEKAGMVREIAKWVGNKQYVITFDYNTNGEDFIFKFYDKRAKKDSEGFNYNTFFEKSLNSKEWITHQSILTSHPESIGGFLQILSNNDTPESKIQFKNMSVYEVPNPNLIFKKKQGKMKEITLPIITFKKVNPTKYKVLVENASDPYLLVFSEQYNTNWKVYKSKISIANEKKISSYFNNQVNEVSHTNEFLNSTTLKNIGKRTIANDKHIVVNGYANGWMIVPNDLDNITNYELTLEYEPQQRFYIFFAVSVITFFILVLYTGYRLVKNDF